MSFSTMLCYSKAHQELIKNISLDHILTETDSPYLAMTKEERNEPANVVKAVKKIAEIHTCQARPTPIKRALCMRLTLGQNIRLCRAGQKAANSSRLHCG